MVKYNIYKIRICEILNSNSIKSNRGNFTASSTLLTKTLTMKKFTFFNCKYTASI